MSDTRIPRSLADTAGWGERGVAISGTGWAARQHTMALRAVGAHVRVIRSASKERATAFADDLGLTDWIYGHDWSDVAAAMPVAIVLADSGRNRADDIEAISRLGIPIVTEKPIALTWTDSLRAAEAVGSAGLPSAVSLVARLTTVVQNARQAMREVGFEVPRWGGVSYHGSVSSQRLTEKPWMAATASSGGLLPLLGIHGLDLLLFLAYGSKPPASLSTLTSTAVPSESVGIPQYIAGSFALEDGFVGSVETALCSPGGPFFDIRLQGDDMTMLGGKLLGEQLPDLVRVMQLTWRLDHRDVLYRRFWERIVSGDPYGDLLSIPQSRLLHQLCFGLERGSRD